MRRALQTGLAVTVVLLVGVLLSARLPPPANGQARQCEIPTEAPRPLDLDRFADRGHLRADAATAESWAIAYADVSPARRQGAAAYAEVQRQCMTALFTRISERHGIDASVVRDYAGRRNVAFDVAVLLLFAFAYVAIVNRLIKVVTRRFARDERFALITSLLMLSFMSVFVVMPIGDTWSIAAEILRVGNGHLSYRTERLPWRQYQRAVALAALLLFWIVATIRNRGDRRDVRGADEPRTRDSSLGRR